MDALSAILAVAEPRAAFFSRARLAAPYGVRTEGTASAIFHVVLEGGGWLVPDRGEPVRLTRGDLVILPHGDGHVICDSPATTPTSIRALPTEPSDDDLMCVVQDGGGDRTEVICGTLAFGSGGQRFILPQLPPVIHVKAGPASWIDATIRLLQGELGHQAPGAELLVQRLTEVLVVQALRGWIEESPSLGGWPGALADDRLARALGAIHAQPQRSWSVAELASRAGMSRTAFYDRFGDVVGEPPRAYLTRWRMVLAQRALSRDGSRVAQVAAEVGYGTEAAFCRAFKREIGMTPATWRTH